MVLESLKININCDSGEADVLPIEDQSMFYMESDLWKMDVIGDIIHDLQREYNELNNAFIRDRQARDNP